MHKNINSYGLYRLNIEIRYLIKSILKIHPKIKRDTDHINEIYEKIRKDKFRKLDSFSTPNDYLSDLPNTYPDGQIRYSLLKNKLVSGKTNQVALMILEIIEGIMINSSCENVIELGSGGGKNLLWFASKYKNIRGNKYYSFINVSAFNINVACFATVLCVNFSNEIQDRNH